MRNKNRVPANYLPPKFNEQERYAYKWLYDCDIRGWSVDLLTKRVHDGPYTWNSLVEFAESQGMQEVSP